MRLGPTGVILGSAGGDEGLGAGHWFSSCQLAVPGMDAPHRIPRDAAVLLPAGNAQGGGSKPGLAQVICAICPSLCSPGYGEHSPDQDIPLLLSLSPSSSAGLVAVARGAPGSGEGTPRLRDGPSGSPGPGQSQHWQRAVLGHVRALALGEAEKNQSRQRRAGLRLLLVLITQECLGCGHCFAV